MGSKEQKDDYELIKRVVEGDQKAFTQLYDQYRARLYSVALRLLKSPTRAEGVVQEVFLKLWKDREKLDSIKKIENYLFVMARNKIYDRFEKLANEQEADKVFWERKEHVTQADNELLEKQYEEILNSILKKLTPQQQEVYKLSKEEHLSQQEIADQMNISRLTVKTHMANALKIIREGLKKHIELALILGLFIS
ncbi:RNA polymerase sigma-70 factor [Fulvivirga maritima]|uniref:RNA polymerase sigma factor n=1 Tax=Fulvivirga maritima TaxID=2904247 RepID=UPI001F33E617|nr:RNA polymerase sigma-70 factor [Fulvivirga maritima]UII25393.1 RNA polymerase sigma-70 factor [Fulvivirga maritima]